jgi:diguanylate cyclase (GGDEF)-like protein/PAS domain S-box-containing protein
MHRWIFATPKRSWTSLTFILLSLAGAAIALSRQQFNIDTEMTQAATTRELTLLNSILTEALRHREYERVDQLLSEWGTSNPKLVELTVVAGNGAELGYYRRKELATRTFSLALPIDYSYHGHATLSAVRDFAPVFERRDRLNLQLSVSFVVLGTLLWSLVYLLLERQKETEQLQRQRTELDAANTALTRENADRRRAEEELYDAKERAEVTLHSIGDAVITTDEAGIVRYMNPVAETLTGWQLEQASGKPLLEVFCIINESSREPADDPVARCLREGRILGVANHTVLISRAGREIAIEDSAAPIRGRGGAMVGVVIVFHDVTQSRAMSQQLSWHATHDALTGLVNRREFENRVTRALATSRAEAHQHALLYIDLDQFKVVNDTCGHVAGDELLRQLSSLLQRRMRTSDTLSRLGGDEFGVLLEQCPLEQATRIADQIRRTTREFRFLWDHKTFEVSASIGVTGIHANSGTLAQILSAVDMACYVAKERGRNRYHVYQESDADFARRHGEMLWVTRISQALREDRFVLYRQAIQPTDKTEATEHYEVLLRIRNEDGTLSAPGSFLPAAERYDLMTAIDRWVITHLFTRQGAALRAAPTAAHPPVLATINVSGASLNDETFLDFVRGAITDHKINPRQVCFEITETVAITHLDRAITLISTLRGLGCRFALDDFGSGLSSFGYLKNLPVDFLKIDGSLVRNVLESDVDAAMVQAINEIGHVMGLSTVAEYVESEALRDRLTAMGVDYLQGYAIEMPRPFPATAADVETTRKG